MRKQHCFANYIILNKVKRRFHFCKYFFEVIARYFVLFIFVIIIQHDQQTIGLLSCRTAEFVYFCSVREGFDKVITNKLKSLKISHKCSFVIQFQIVISLSVQMGIAHISAKSRSVFVRV